MNFFNHVNTSVHVPLFQKVKEVLFALKFPQAKNNSPGRVTADSQHCNWN